MSHEGEEVIPTKWVVCRVCLENKNEKDLKVIFTKDDDTLVEDIRKFGGIQCIESDCFPDKICNKCLLLLKASKTFWTLSQESEESLKSLSQGFEYVAYNCFSDDIQEEEDEPDLSMHETIIPDQNQIDITCKIETNQDSRILEEKTNTLKQVPIKDNAHSEKLEDPRLNNVVEVYTVRGTITEHDDSSMQSTEATTQHEQQHQNDEFVDIEVLHQMEYNSSTNSHEENVKRKMTQKEENTENSESGRDEELLQLINIKEEPPSNQSGKCNKRRTVQRASKKKLDEFPYICPVCANFYTEKSKLTLHMKIHNKVKPHVCELCGKSFSQTPQLARHMNSHTGLRPYKCKYCDSCFADPSTCIKHQRIHTNERPYKCELCGKAFSYSNVLKVHMLTHTGEKPFACQFCDKRFTQVHHMKSHERTHQQTVELVKIEDISIDDGESITGS